MNLRSLQYLVALADHQHFGKAADACFVSQPTLSMQIKKLEEQLDVLLIERTNKSLLFTSIGHAVVARSRRILEEAQQIKDLAKYHQNPHAGELRIGIIPTLAPYLLPLIMPTLSSTFPDLTLYLVEEQTQRAVAKLRKGELDCCILALPIDDDSFISQPLFNEPFLLAVPKNHAFAKHNKLQQQDLADQTLLLLEDGHCLRDQALEVCQLVQANTSQDFNATSLETLRHMVAAGVGITLIPELATRVAHPNIAYVGFTKPEPVRTIGMLWRKTSAKEQLILDVLEIVKTLIQGRTYKKSPPPTGEG